MSKNFDMRFYVRTSHLAHCLTTVVRSVQTHGWSYNEIYPGGYTKNEDMDWVFEDRDAEADGLETGIETIADIGVGALSLSKEITEEIRGLRIHVDSLETAQRGDGSMPEPVQVVDVTTDYRYVSAHESVATEFLNTFTTLVQDVEPTMAFAGAEHAVPRVTPQELETKPAHIAPLTYFGSAVCDAIGRERLLSAPAESITEIGDGLLMLACTNYVGGCAPDVYDSLSAHLDISFA